MKSYSGVGGVLVLLFILGVIVLAVSLVSYMMSVQERLRELHEERVQVVAESIELGRSIQSFWLFQKNTSILTINVTNMYSKPVGIVSGIIVYYDKTYDLLYGDLKEKLGNRVIMVRLYYAGKLIRVWPRGLGFKLPFWLNPGYTLSVTIDTNDRDPLTVKFAAATAIALCVVAGQQYTPGVTIIPPTPTPTPAPWTEPLRFRVRIDITSPYTRFEWPFAIRLDFSKPPINFPYRVDPESIIVVDAYTGERVPLNKTIVGESVFWLVFPVSIVANTVHTYYIYFDKETPQNFTPAEPYHIGLAKPVSEAIEEAHTNLDYKLFENSGWNNNNYVLLSIPSDKLRKFTTPTEEIKPNTITQLPTPIPYFNSLIERVNVTRDYALIVEGPSKPGLDSLKSGRIIAVLWGLETVKVNVYSGSGVDHKIKFNEFMWRGYTAPWALAEWKYRKTITVINNSPITLKDYPVKIILNSTNFNGWSKVKSDGSDLRFSLDPKGEKLLYYWIEYFNSTRKYGIVWVKIPNIPANSKINIYMFYGNPTASIDENLYGPLKVFLYYNDLSTIDNWIENYDNGEHYINDSKLYFRSTDINRVNKGTLILNRLWSLESTGLAVVVKLRVHVVKAFIPIEIHVGNIKTTLPYYPFLLRLNLTWYVSTGLIKQDLSNIEITDEDDNPLPFYIVKFNPINYSDVWVYVRVDNVKPNTTIKLRLWFGDTIRTPTYNPVSDVGLVLGPWYIDVNRAENGEPLYRPHHILREWYDRVWAPRVTDLYPRYWGDAGRDAFDRWGYPNYYFGDKRAADRESIGPLWPIMKPGKYHGSIGEGSSDSVIYRYSDIALYTASQDDAVWYAITFMPTGPILGWLIVPDEYSWVNHVKFSIKFHGNLGSDAGTDGPYEYTVTLIDGRMVKFYMTNDDEFGVRGDPRIWYIGIAGNSEEQDRFYMGRSRDNSWMGFHGVCNPITLYLGVGDINPNKLSLWIKEDIGYIPPCKLSEPYNVTYGNGFHIVVGVSILPENYNTVSGISATLSNNCSLAGLVVLDDSWSSDSPWTNWLHTYMWQNIELYYFNNIVYGLWVKNETDKVEIEHTKLNVSLGLNVYVGVTVSTSNNVLAYGVYDYIYVRPFVYPEPTYSISPSVDLNWITIVEAKTTLYHSGDILLQYNITSVAYGEYYIPITITVGDIKTSLPYYPFLIHLNLTKQVEEGKIRSDLSNIMFTDEYNNPLPFYIVKFNPINYSDVWVYVRVDNVKPNTTIKLRLWFGGNVKTKRYDPVSDVGLVLGYKWLDVNNITYYYPCHILREWYDRVWAPRVTDLYPRYWGDAGRDAFDRWGYPNYYFGDTVNPKSPWNIMRPNMDRIHGDPYYGSRDSNLYRWIEPEVYSVSSTEGNTWYAITFMPTGPLLCWQLIPDESSWVNGQEFSIKLRGNLGSDAGTDGPYEYTVTLIDGRMVKFYMTNDDEFGVRGDPRIWYIGIAGNSEEQDRFYMGRSRDNSWMGFHGVLKPILLILGVGDINPEKLSKWINSIVGYIPPCKLSKGYTIKVGNEVKPKVTLDLKVCIGIGSGSESRWVCLLSNINGYYNGTLSGVDPNITFKLCSTDYLLLYLPGYEFKLYGIESNPEAFSLIRRR